MNILPFDEVARLADPADNVAIATRRLETATRLTRARESLVLSHTVLEGHRFAVTRIPSGGPLLSWQLPFGKAIADLSPGHYVCNQMMLQELRIRRLDFDLPDNPNFQDFRRPYRLDPERFSPGQQVLPPHPDSQSQATFLGFNRGPERPAGTRNHIVVLGTTSRTAPYARALADRFRQAHGESMDGVVAVAHTEGGGTGRPNNAELVLRTLAGFMVHSNVGAVLAVDHGHEPINNTLLRTYMLEHGYPLDAVPHQFLSVRAGFESALAQGETVVRQWLNSAGQATRTPQPLSHLKVALQCGGSDAFSGVSGNPLAGWIAKELIRHGGAANLAETSELIGAEPYILRNVRDLATAQTFLEQLERFQQWAAWHGHSAEGNPSGGNLYRGLYNIVIKSIGAARKKDPDVRLDACIDYAQPMTAPGFYFMDSPGNDLESIAGQVAAGCNLILFITGNGSITNFPFVPTLKIVTTTGRFQLLQREMDINAGRYLDGETMANLGAEAFQLSRAVASGQRTVGETAGHSQVQLWREWRQTDDTRLADLAQEQKPSGKPIPLKPDPGSSPEEESFVGFVSGASRATDQIALILPTSLCAGQIALGIARTLDQNLPAGVTRCVALPHTEGCGNSRGDSERLYLRTMAGYLSHPMVRRALLLEHGCEKTHNDEMRRFLREANIDTRKLGWASIQLDGGIEAVTRRVVDWFHNNQDGPARTCPAHLGDLRLGILADTTPPLDFCQSCATLVQRVVQAGGTVVVTDGSPLLQTQTFQGALDAPVHITLEYGQTASQPGLHVMDIPTDDRAEWVTGLGATGAGLLIVYSADSPWQAHSMIPLLQIGPPELCPDIDLIWPPSPDQDPFQALLSLVLATAGRAYTPNLMLKGNTSFQITRGLVGVSL